MSACQLQCNRTTSYAPRHQAHPQSQQLELSLTYINPTQNITVSHLHCYAIPVLTLLCIVITQNPAD